MNQGKEDLIQLSDPHGKGAVLARLAYDQIFRCMISAVHESPDGVIELNYLIEQVEQELADKVKQNLSWKILQVKKHLEAIGEITVKYTYGRVPVITIPERAKALVRSSPSKARPVKVTAVFSLVHEKNSTGEIDFLEHFRKVAALPYVESYECRRTSGRLNNFDFGLSMTFRNYTAYNRYITHENFVTFVNNRWKNEVKGFQHIAYEATIEATVNVLSGSDKSEVK
jgi:hypothetical protein